MEQKKQSFMQALDEFIRPNRQGYLFSVLTSILGVACSIVPYICAGQIITELIQGQTSMQKILPWVLLALAGYFLKVCFSNLSTSLSHKATFSTLEALRKAMVEKWQRVPMGYFQNNTLGSLKTSFVDRIDSMEPILAHMFPEMTANLSLARQQLEEYETAKQPEVHFVFRGFETAMARAGKLLEDAREEVYLNADFDLSCFAETFHRLKEKGVRIVAFSFYDLGLNREDVEFYTHGGMLTAHQPSRLMLVTDRQMTLTADCGAFANWSGTVSNNGLMVKILSEHIQHDITLLQLQEKYGLEMH